MPLVYFLFFGSPRCTVVAGIASCAVEMALAIVYSMDTEIVYDSEAASPETETKTKPSVQVLLLWRLFTKSLSM